MKRFIINIIFFILIVAAIDMAFGKICTYLNSHSKGGDTKKHYYIAKETNDDILIFGSSRACHHYVPGILSDSLQMKTYNCGVEGNGILLSYSYMKLITNHHTPKIVIYDISNFDIITDDYTKYLGWQKRFYDEPGIAEVFNDVIPIEKYKMVSNLYQYNEKWLQMLSDNVLPKQLVLNGGYKPIYSTMDYKPKAEMAKLNPLIWDETKKKYFKKFHDLCKQNEITFIVAYSPLYKAESSIQYQEVSDFCKENNITLWDYYSDTTFSRHHKYFADTDHMNDEGAIEYTKLIAHKLKKLIKTED